MNTYADYRYRARRAASRGKCTSGKFVARPDRTARDFASRRIVEIVTDPRSHPIRFDPRYAGAHSALTTLSSRLSFDRCVIYGRRRAPPSLFCRTALRDTFCVCRIIYARNKTVSRTKRHNNRCAGSSGRFARPRIRTAFLLRADGRASRADY